MDSTPRSFWPLGRILEVYSGKDNVVRSVKLKLPNSIVTRPANKICFLEECD